MSDDGERPAADKQRISWPKILGLTVVAMLVTIVATVWIVKVFVFPSRFRPVALSTKEQKVLDDKLERLEGFGERHESTGAGSAAGAVPPILEPEAYSEKETDREITFTEREINALLAKNTELASRLAIDLADGLVSAKLLIPMDEDLPVIGGQTLRVNAGVGLAYAGGKPIVVLKGVSIMGVPIPGAWLGGLKNIDLVEEFGGEASVWRAFAAGAEALEVRDGSMRVRLKE